MEAARDVHVVDRERIAREIWPCRLALFWTMFGSIFTAAFFAYADSTTGGDIEQWLYFTRLFGDLGGRPLTALPRPSWLRSGPQLAVFSVARLIFSAVFFVYVFVPGVTLAARELDRRVADFAETSTGWFSHTHLEDAATCGRRAGAAVGRVPRRRRRALFALVRLSGHHFLRATRRRRRLSLSFIDDARFGRDASSSFDGRERRASLRRYAARDFKATAAKAHARGPRPVSSAAPPSLFTAAGRRADEHDVPV